MRQIRKTIRDQVDSTPDPAAWQLQRISLRGLSMYNLTIRPAIPSDGLQLRSAVIELQEYESRLHSTRLPGEQIADAYLKWMQQQAVEGGAVLVAEIEGEFVGFVSGWIEQERNIAESLDSNRFGYVSDICVLPAYRGRRIARQLLHALEIHLSRADVRRIRIVSLAANGSARASYESAGFAPYEVVYEKIIPGPSASRSK